MSENTIRPEAATAAAEWWRDQISGDVKQDNGDPKGSALGTIARKQVHGDGIPKAKLDSFEAALEELLAGAEILGKARHVSVDYGPGPDLTEAAEAAEIPADTLSFPWKTSRWIERDRILVGRDRELIWASDEWPPTVLEIAVDAIRFTIEIPDYMAEDGNLQSAIEDMLPRDRYEGYDLCLRHLDVTEVIEAEATEDEHGADVIRATVEAEATVFVSESHLEDFETDNGYAIVGAIANALRGKGTDEIREELLEAIVTQKFEAFSHYGVDVETVELREWYAVEAW